MFVLYNADADGNRLSTDVTLCRDGCQVTVPAGEPFALSPGESLTLTPYCYHAFWGAPGSSVLVGEVSSCNDDDEDNRFYEPIGRFPAIEEDEPAYRLLCTEYPPAP